MILASLQPITCALSQAYLMFSRDTSLIPPFPQLAMTGSSPCLCSSPEHWEARVPHLLSPSFISRVPYLCLPHLFQVFHLIKSSSEWGSPLSHYFCCHLYTHFQYFSCSFSPYFPRSNILFNLLILFYHCCPRLECKLHVGLLWFLRHWE